MEAREISWVLFSPLPDGRLMVDIDYSQMAWEREDVQEAVAYLQAWLAETEKGCGDGCRPPGV